MSLWPRWAGRRGPLVAELIALGGLVVLDAVFAVRAGVPHEPVAMVAYLVAPGVGPPAAVLALLRRRFADRVVALAGCLAGLSLLGTVIALLAAALGERLSPQPDGTETLALALVVGACCHQGSARPAAAAAVLGGLAMTVGPVLRYGPSGAGGLLAVLAAVLWGCGIAVGLLLRDADTRRDMALAQVRTAERLQLARELHDLVAHHITGVVVRAQAARVIAARGRPTPESDTGEPDPANDIFEEIERAGAEALAAMRRLVGMLRTERADSLTNAPAGLAEAVAGAVPDPEGITVSLADGVAALTVPPETASTVQRVVMEAVTNVRRHAPRATEVRVELRTEHQPDGAWLIVEITNDGVAAVLAGAPQGYGLVGMAERVTALGGNVHAGRRPARRWQVTARLPLVPVATGGVGVQV